LCDRMANPHVQLSLIGVGALAVSARPRGESASEFANLGPVRSREQLLILGAQRQKRDRFDRIKRRHRQGKMRFCFFASRSNGHSTQCVVDSCSTLQEGTERRSIRQKSTQSHVSLLLLIRGQSRISLHDLRKELPVLSYRSLRGRQRRRRGRFCCSRRSGRGAPDGERHHWQQKG
jgi:hypothetical protein